MPRPEQLILGEFRRKLDDRHRVLIPRVLAGPLTVSSTDCVLVKERPGCLSLWPAADWTAKLEQGVEWIEEKLRREKLEDETGRLQVFGRLFSTRHTPVQLAGRGRLVIPEGFREFLGVDSDGGGGEVMIVGAAVCVEIWSPTEWLEYLKRQVPRFRRLFKQLTE